MTEKTPAPPTEPPKKEPAKYVLALDTGRYQATAPKEK